MYKIIFPAKPLFSNCEAYLFYLPLVWAQHFSFFFFPISFSFFPFSFSFFFSFLVLFLPSVTSLSLGILWHFLFHIDGTLSAELKVDPKENYIQAHYPKLTWALFSNKYLQKDCFPMKRLSWFFPFAFVLVMVSVKIRLILQNFWLHYIPLGFNQAIIDRNKRK